MYIDRIHFLCHTADTKNGTRLSILHASPTLHLALTPGGYTSWRVPFFVLKKYER